MEDFSKLFIDEAKDLLSKLEETLMFLEDDNTNKELINEVFRIMHSLKGSGAMFGYVNLSAFTHSLENLYDRVRSDEINLSTEIISLTMKSGDHIEKLLENDSDENLIPKTNELNYEIEKFLISKKDISKGKLIVKEPPNPININNSNVYYINFEPNEDILCDGTKPLFLIDEIVELGDALVAINKSNLPEFEDINTEKCYLSWTIILSTTCEKDEILDVFIFVEDDSRITIEKLSDNDLFSQLNAKSTFEYLLQNKPDSLDSFKQAAKTLEESISKEPEISVIDELNIEVESLKDYESKKEPLQTTNIKKNQIKNPEALNIDTVKVSSSKLDTLINLVSELVTTQARLVNIASENKSTELTLLSEDFQHLSRQFRDIAFEMRLIPIHNMVVKFKRLVRDLSKNLGKKVDFTTRGTETELDKNLIATLSDPIMHIIRNSIDHGIELPDKRTENNKPESGTIHLSAQYSGTSIIIQIEDDGGGINTEKILHKALEKDLVNPSDKLSESQIYELLMLPGFSTSEIVTDISGRGVGMDVVKKKINDLRGEVTISSEFSKGTKVTIKLPLTLSIIDGLLVTINHDRFVIPLSSVKQIYQVNKNTIAKSANNIINIEGIQLPFINLPHSFSHSNNPETETHLITVTYHDKIVGLLINQLISEYQAVLKPISKVMEKNEIFAGASILGDGKVALVLDTNKLIEFYSNLTAE